MTTDPNAGGPAGTPNRRLAGHNRDIELALGFGLAGEHHACASERGLTAADLLACALPPACPTAAVPGADLVGEVLRRVSANVAQHQAGTYRRAEWWYDFNRACLSLNAIARQAIAKPAALSLLARFADRDEDDPYEVQATITIFSDEDLDTEISGALLFGYVLHLAGHPVSASFWWKIAAGAGDRRAAYAMYLHHLQRGEMHEADWWIDEACRPTDNSGNSVAPSFPQVPGYRRSIPAVMEQSAGKEDVRPAVVIAEMVNSLVVCGEDSGRFDGIAERPDRRLAPQLADLAGHC